MRIKHSPYEFYGLYTSYRDYGLYPVKHYASKQSALKGMEKYKKSTHFSDDVKWVVIWYPSPFCSEDKGVIVYDER